MPEREGGITDAGFSVVEYERWMETGDPAILDAIAAYNRDDCVSTWLLRDWLEARRRRGRAAATPTASSRGREPVDGGAAGGARGRAGRDPGPRGRAPRGVPADRAERDDEQQGRWLLAGTPRLASPRGEAAVVGLLPAASRRRSTTWSRDGSALGGLRVRRGPGADQEVAPPPLPVRPGAGDEARDGRRQPRSTRRPAEGAGEIVELDPLRGHARAQAQPGQARIRVALIPGAPFRTEADARGARPARRPRDRARDRPAPGPYRAARDLILRRPPRATLQPERRAARPGRRDAARRRPPSRHRARRQRARRSRGRPAPARPTPAPG